MLYLWYFIKEISTSYCIVKILKVISVSIINNYVKILYC